MNNWPKQNYQSMVEYYLMRWLIPWGRRRSMIRGKDGDAEQATMRLHGLRPWTRFSEFESRKETSSENGRR
jgi:hypothetical protein